MNGNVHIMYRGHSFLLWLYSYYVVVKDGSQYGQLLLGISYILHGILCKCNVSLNSIVQILVLNGMHKDEQHIQET